MNFPRPHSFFCHRPFRDRDPAAAMPGQSGGTSISTRGKFIPRTFCFYSFILIIRRGFLNSRRAVAVQGVCRATIHSGPSKTSCRSSR